MIEYYVQHHENESPVRIEVNLSLADDEPDMFKPLLLWVFVKMKSPDASGLCSATECVLLQKMRERLCDSLEEELKAVFSGSRMSDGWFECYFYARSGKKLMAAAGNALESFDGYTFDVGSSRDEAWQHYENELYPDGLMFHQIQNRRIIGELLEEGDDITKAREVEHYMFFQLPAQQERALQRLQGLGYEVKEHIEQEGDYCYGAVLVKEQDVTEATMMESVALMEEVAAVEHGMYEGWSTVLAK